MDYSLINAAYEQVRDRLMTFRSKEGCFWEGELSSSALSTATAVCALALARGTGIADEDRLEHLVQSGLHWLAQHVNEDGGWGDTVLSFSNISTTALVWAAFGVVDPENLRYPQLVGKMEAWLARQSGGGSSLDLEKLSETVVKRYGRDRTFSVPILTMCALSGRLGEGSKAWEKVIPLPFELALFPRRMYAALQLPVVSYALPALIAIGLVRHVRAPSRWPVVRWMRSFATQPALKVLDQIQPSNGGFLEATPLTSFVSMSLLAAGLQDHPVTRRGIRFLLDSVREDGSWPIDTHLATWVTTLSVNALGEDLAGQLKESDREGLVNWLLNQQYADVHPYTGAAPGGWAWTPLPGGVPDADDTSGALVALKTLMEAGAAPGQEKRILEAAIRGCRWLLDLQNRDGGIPTFCRGWGKLPFDRSSPDLTAHTVLAWNRWRSSLDHEWRKILVKGMSSALRFLENAQLRNGGWNPLWFGNEHSDDESNPVYGTSRVLRSLADLELGEWPACEGMIFSGTRWLVNAQREDGGWNGGKGGPASLEETALALEALAAVIRQNASELLIQFAKPAFVGGLRWLILEGKNEMFRPPAPIGFYFAKLWYYEKLYPFLFGTGALRQATKAWKSI